MKNELDPHPVLPVRVFKASYMILACRTAGEMVSISDIALLKRSLNPCLIYAHTVLSLTLLKVMENNNTFSLAIAVLYKRLPLFSVYHKLLCVVLRLQ